MNSNLDNQNNSIEKINGNSKTHTPDIALIPLFYGEKTTTKNESNHISMQMADYCTQLFFLS